MMTKNLFRLVRNEKGMMAVVAGAAFSATLLMMALGIDVGLIFGTQTELQNTADAAALAAVTKLPVTSDEAKSYAMDVAKDHKAGGLAIDINLEDIVPGRYNFQAKTFSPGVEPINAAEVTASRDSHVTTGNLALYFAQLAGYDDVALNKRALAAVDPRVVGVMGWNHLIPYSAHIDIVDSNGDGKYDLGKQIDLYLNDGRDRGNFGFLNLNGGDLGTPELDQFIRYGYDQDFVVPVGGVLPVLGDTGIRGMSLMEAFETVYYDFENQTGQILYMPVHQSWTGNGANAVFDVVGIVGIKLQQVQLNGNMHSRFIRADIVYNISSAFIIDETAPENNSLQKLRLIE